MKPRVALLLLVALLCGGVCVRLGLWQLSRWKAKRSLVLALERALAETPRVYRDSLPTAADVMGRRISLAGRYDETRQFLLRGRLRAGEQGVEVVTPLVLPSNRAVLVNRGWLEAVDGATARPQDFPEPGIRTVVGYVEPLARAPRGYPYLSLPADSAAIFSAALLDPDSVAARLPYEVAPYVVRESPGPGTPPRPQRFQPEPPNLGMHMGYAIQWFAIAAIVVVGGVWLAWSRRERGSAKPLG